MGRDREYIVWKDVKPEFRNHYAANILIGYHNAHTHLLWKCGWDCGRDCNECENHKDILHLEDLMDRWAKDVERDFPEFRAKLTKDYLHDQVFVDMDLSYLLKKKRTANKCTEITDKNGTLIYENDYVRTKHGRICQVEFRHTGSTLGWDMKPVDKLECPPPDEEDMWDSKNIEVLVDYEPEEEREG